MAALLEHFDALTKFGIQVIPIRENSKVPRLKQWQKNWNMRRSRRVLQQYPYSNIGVLLGNIIDIEGDTPQANERINDLIGDYPHPCYKSRRSVHHLFLTPDPQLTIFKHEDIEFRGIGHQSVLPPSKHQGIEYKWLGQFHFPIPEVPEKLLKFYWKLQKTGKNNIKPGHMSCWCATCEKKCYMHKKRWNLEVRGFRMLGESWQCHKCRQHDMRPICRQLRRSGHES